MKTLNLDFVEQKPYAVFFNTDTTYLNLEQLKKVNTVTFNKGQEQALKLNQRINDLADINYCFRSINELLAIDGKLEGTFIDFNGVTDVKQYQIPGLNLLIRYNRFLIKRYGLNNSILNATYKNLNLKRNKHLTKSEVLGRLVYCGFSIEKVTEKNGFISFIVSKKSSPLPEQKVSEGFFYAMPRVGKNGKIIHVYKIRTMHPYSEFLQAYLKKENGYSHTGKIKNDYRVTKLGNFYRKYWIDELPQLLNVFKGEMKLVGFRPVSKTYFEDLPTEIQQLRMSQKPGCIPPYVALNKKSSVEGVLESEKHYFDYQSKHRFTDIVFFFYAIYNILIKGKRSA